MSLSFAHSIMQRLAVLWPLLPEAAILAVLLTATAAVAIFSPILAFVSAVSPSSSFSRPCNADDFVSFPLDVPGEMLCVPLHRVNSSVFDFYVSTVFLAVVVVGSAYALRALL
ncbi:uncharacterized protein LOC132269739 [Cornus florida]|uniref:uncharacterized protein LOC132269739 n=1 Tax=Cornus florida TaxID=4283 RepID=UPI00289C26E9|nr:uncharacterized protein LOC132269739 [Cornus florida]